MPRTKKNNNNKWLQIINYRVRVTLLDARIFVGTFKAIDKHMNIILSECDEYRKYRNEGDAPPREEKRVVGFVLLRGYSVLTIEIEGPPPPPYENLPRLPLPGSMPGPGAGHPAGRGIPPARIPMVPSMFSSRDGIPSLS